MDLQGDEDAASTSVKEHASSKGLSMEEIFGIIFVINFAGHDTTANTLAFSMLLLAAHSEVRAWIAEELRGVVLGEGKFPRPSMGATASSRSLKDVRPY